MSVNENRPHLFVLPEDDANRQIVNGFKQVIPGSCYRAFADLPIAGGGGPVLDRFEKVHVQQMNANSHMHMILMIDLDGTWGRSRDKFQYAQTKIPTNLQNRVFVLSSALEPEDLKSAVRKSYEAIGMALAEECRTGQFDLWNHEQLVHNQNEVNRVHGFIQQHILPP